MTEEKCALEVGSWNIGGTCLLNAPKAITEVMYQLKDEAGLSSTISDDMLVMLQELPRDVPGWKTEEVSRRVDGFGI